MQSVPIKDSSRVSEENIDDGGDEEEERLKQSIDNLNFMSGNMMMSVNTSQLTVDERNHPVAQIDQMEFKIKVVDVETGAEARANAGEEDGCKDCGQSRSALSQRSGGDSRLQKPEGDRQYKQTASQLAQLRTSQTTEDNFKNIQMLNNDLKKFKKAPENNLHTDSKRQAEIQNIKTTANQLRHGHLHSNSSMTNMKIDAGNELVKNSQSSQNSRGDNEHYKNRPKTAELEVGDEAKKKADLTKMSNTNAIQNGY